MCDFASSCRDCCLWARARFCSGRSGLPGQSPQSRRPASLQQLLLALGRVQRHQQLGRSAQHGKAHTSIPSTAFPQTYGLNGLPPTDARRASIHPPDGLLACRDGDMAGTPVRVPAFMKNPDFGGDCFCLRARGGYPNLPPGFNDRISSERLPASWSTELRPPRGICFCPN